MKKMRKLLPAVAMLLLSAVLMSTASFAWFATNTTAVANGFNIQVAAAKNLLIKDSTASDYKSSVVYEASDVEANKKNLKPASTDPSTVTATVAPVFYSVADAGDMDPDSYAAAADTTFAATTDNYITKTVHLNATGEYDEGKTAFGNVNAKITVGGATTSPVMPSLRILLVVKSGSGESATCNTFLYAPISGATATYKPVIGTAATNLGTEITTYSNDSTAIITGMPKETQYTVDIYMWFEGQDASCKATNAINLVSNSVTIDFNLVAA